MSDKHRPRWVAAKEQLTCQGCKKTINKGEKTFLLPKQKQFFCQGCGKGVYELEMGREEEDAQDPEPSVR